MEPRQEDQEGLEGGQGMTEASSNQSSGSGAVRDGYEFDTEALRKWMKENIDGFSGDLSVEQFKGGQSNPTYKLITPDKNYVLRRKPPGPILKGAHAVDREARIQSALGQTGYPVATIHGLCMDDSVLGSDFYVMDLVEGRIFWDTSFPDVSERNKASLFRCHECNHGAAALKSTTNLWAWAIMVGLETSSSVRSVAGQSNTSPMS